MYVPNRIRYSRFTLYCLKTFTKRSSSSVDVSPQIYVQWSLYTSVFRNKCRIIALLSWNIRP